MVEPSVLLSLQIFPPDPYSHIDLRLYNPKPNEGVNCIDINAVTLHGSGLKCCIRAQNYNFGEAIVQRANQFFCQSYERFFFNDFTFAHFTSTTLDCSVCVLFISSVILNSISHYSPSGLCRIFWLRLPGGSHTVSNNRLILSNLKPRQRIGKLFEYLINTYSEWYRFSVLYI